MKKLIVMVMVTVSFHVASAGTLQVSCKTNTEETVEVYVSTDESKNPAYLEIYNQSGLGPNFLESSYVAIETDLRITPDDQMTLKARFGQFVEINLDFQTRELGQGSMKFKGTEATELKNCTHNF
jgi:hypothetical protein